VAQFVKAAEEDRLVASQDVTLDRKAQQRQKILDAARQVFFRDGFIAANLDEVAAIAGVAKGTLYRYFANKADLYVALLADNGDKFVAKLRDAASGTGSASDRIRAVGKFYYGHWAQNRDYFQIFWALDNQGMIGVLPPALVGQVTALWESCLRILAGVIDDGVKQREFAPCDSWEVANLLWTFGNGLIQTEHVMPRKELRHKPLDVMFDDGLELILRGLSRAQSPASAST
jgi:AcrR family transcriptional regulator